jgi:hypothetical protein
MPHGKHPRATQGIASVLIGILALLPLRDCFSDELIGIITGDGVTTRAGPGVEYEKVGRLHTGDHTTVLEEREKWLKMKPDEQPLLPHESESTEQPLAQPEPGPVNREFEPTPAVQEALAVTPPPLVEEKGRSIPWIWIGAGVTAAGVLGYALLSGEEKASETGSVHIHVEFP